MPKPDELEAAASTRGLNEAATALHLVPSNVADELAVGRRDEDAFEAALVEPAAELRGCASATNRAWPVDHELVRNCVWPRGDLARAEPSQHDSLLVHDHGKRPIAGACLISYGAYALTKAACRYVSARDVGRGLNVCPAAGHRQARGEPIVLAWLIAVDLFETKGLEPPRGPCAHVSEEVVAVGDDRLRTVEFARRALAKLLERDVDRARQMQLVVLLAGQHLDKLSAFRQKPLHASARHVLRHRGPHRTRALRQTRERGAVPGSNQR
jgi:hypothetical protein